MAKQSKKRWLIIKAALVSQASVDADVTETINKITGVTDTTKPIKSKYPAQAAWLADADKIEKRLVVVHGYAAFRLNDKEARSSRKHSSRLRAQLTPRAYRHSLAQRQGARSAEEEALGGWHGRCSSKRP